jgi:hypothetical protein
MFIQSLESRTLFSRGPLADPIIPDGEHYVNFSSPLYLLRQVLDQVT